MQFNGTLVYFSLLYELGLESSRVSTGMFFLLLVGSAFLGGLALTARKPREFRLTSIDVLFLVFFSLVFLSYFAFSKGTAAAHVKITYAPLLVVGPYICVQLLLSQRRMQKYLDYCVLLAAVMIIPSLYGLSFTNASRFSLYEFHRAGGVVLTNPILYGITFGNLLIIVGVWVLESRRFRARYFALIIPSAFLMLRAGSRGALVSFLVTFTVYIVALAKIRLRSKCLSIGAIILLLIVSYRFIPKSTTDFYKSTLEYESLPESSVFVRISMWQQAFRDFESSPIFGVGMGNSVEGGGSPHNILLEVSAELGVLGLLVLLAICALTVKKAKSLLQTCEDYNLVVLMKISLLFFVYSLIEAMFSGYITNQTHLFMSIAFVSAISKMQDTQKPSMRRLHTTIEEVTESSVA
jgi:O-antigen ligase